MADLVLPFLGDPDDDGTLTRDEIRRWRELCRYCGRPLGRHRFGRGRFCSIRCRKLWHRSRPHLSSHLGHLVEDVPTGGAL